MEKIDSKWLNENIGSFIDKERTREEKIKILDKIKGIGKKLKVGSMLFDVPEIDENSNIDKMFNDWCVVSFGLLLKILEDKERVPDSEKLSSRELAAAFVNAKQNH